MDIFHFILFLMVFERIVVGWCLRELWLVQYLDLLEPTVRAILSAVIKIAIWVIPVIYLIKFFEKRDPFTFLRLRRPSRQGLKWIGIVFILLTLYLVINLLLLKNTIDFHMDFHEWLNVVFLAGVTEEIVFRGFILQKLMGYIKFWMANMITSVLFLSIHFPIWFYRDLFQFPTILTTMISIFLLSLLFGYFYKKSASLWPSMIFHSLYNLLVVLFY